MVAAVTVGDLILFAGGELAEDEAGQGKSTDSKRVDIWRCCDNSTCNSCLACIPAILSHLVQRFTGVEF